MTVRHVTRSILVCDGCAAEFGADGGGYENTLTAHAEAYVAGWRYPSKVTRDGRPVSATSDVCPECVPTWEPVVDARSVNKSRS